MSLACRRTPLIFALSVALIATALILTTSSLAVSQDEAQGSSQIRSQRITLNLQNVTLGSVLKIMTQKSGINFLIGSDLVGKEINVYLENVLVEDAIAAIMRANGLWFTRQKGTNIYVITDAPEGPPVTTMTEVMRLDFAAAEELEATVKAVLTEVGSIVVEPRTNSLVVSDIPENMTTLQGLVRDLDVQTGQVLIEAKIVEFTDEAATELGISWGYDDFEPPNSDGKGAFSYGSTFNQDSASEGILELSFGKFESFIDVQDLEVKLQAMKKDGLAEVLAKPQILTLDNKEAVIEITTHLALAKKVTYREGGTESTVEPIFGDVGVTLKVTPHINNDEFVTMSIEPMVSSAQRSSYFPDEAVDTKQRKAVTTVMAKNGETIVIGGLLRKDVVETHFKVPILGDIPLLGALFRKSITSDVDTEVVLFLTPQLLGAEALGRLSERMESDFEARMMERH